MRQPSTVTTPWGWALAGALLGLLLTTLLQAPARWFTPWLQSATQGRFLLEEARGTLWHGSAQLTLAGGGGSSDAATLPGRVAWTMAPVWSGLQVDLRAECCLQQPWRLSLQPRWGGARLALTDSPSQWPAKALSGLGTPWNTVQLDGDLALSTQGLSLEWTAGRLRVTGRAQLDATHIASRLSTLKPLGSYRITLQGGPTATLQLETLQGSLQLSGSGQWVGGKLRFDGVASAAPTRQDALDNLLNILGRRDGARAIIKVG